MLFSKKIGTQVAVTLNGSQLAATTFSELPDDVLNVLEVPLWLRGSR